MGRVAVAVIVSLWVVPMSILVNRVVPEPYMDEIFHIPQAQQYCRGNFRSWDPMITTPPGLYYLSLAYVGILYPGMIFTRAISSFPDICSPAILRSVNAVLAVICSVLVYEIMTLLRPGVNDRNATACAVVLASYPLQWFFTFLYYTDAASLTMVLAMYLACLKKRYWISALLGALSVIVRQTNIVWILFAACTGIIDITLLSGKFHVKVADIDGPINEPSQLIRKKGKISSNLRRRKYNGAVDAGEIVRPTANIFSSEMPGLLDEIKAILSTSWHMKWEILVHFVPFVMILVAFIAFIRWNGSIVLGAKDAHTVSPHFAQVMYFGLVSTLAMAPVHFSWGQAARISRSLWRNRPLSFLQVLIAICASFLSVHFFSIAHPYLLADNRHYPFYLWRKVINAHWSMRYLLVPLYAYSWLSIFSVLGRYRKRIWIVAYFLATAAILVPAPLIEFRYYTVPFYLLMLHSNVTDNQSWFLMGFLYVVTNIFTMSMFLFQPFQWDHEPGFQRFIW
ncbi:dol-P-Glc:Glc(2)Man(9)GlcNAc(2)-PP-Dol alpha-1,2-glucosyltransferase isoform X1 [Syzygium oleosum]|uniref:dol-P-Glc:Glc(2)Man(9)GlcNAc(2)-PP-Dol alpha-1,2-glucosyltransferase isoform X1 n=2 Tax=Syzygium oleosum TaxID=219896 RepID=UPI0011D18A9F|nr:dol-P-Glc:Glc(2)Man(9)GlcNAc(2)-PP-Dol alpha-1,2-glucosyltransferase isoform X1 [Syzygium oleosum]